MQKSHEMTDIQLFNLKMRFQQDFDSTIEVYMPVGKKKQSNPRDISGMPTEAKLKIACYILSKRTYLV